MIDEVTLVDVAYGVSKAALLPWDMEREKGYSYDAPNEIHFSVKH